MAKKAGSHKSSCKMPRAGKDAKTQTKPTTKKPKGGKYDVVD